MAEFGVLFLIHCSGVRDKELPSDRQSPHRMTKITDNSDDIDIMPVQGELIRFLKFASGELLPLYISKTTKTYRRVISAIAPEVIDEQTKRVAEEASTQFPPKTAAIAFR